MWTDNAAAKFVILALVAVSCTACAGAVESDQAQRLDAPAIYARAEKALAGIKNLHAIITSGDGFGPAEYRDEVWQQGNSFRRDDGRHVFLLGERYAVQLDRRVNIAQAALRQASDGEFFLEAGKLQRAFGAREAADQPSGPKSQQPRTRSRNGRQEIGLFLEAFSGQEGLDPVIWFDSTTGLPTEIRRTTRDDQGDVVYTWHATYDYDVPLPAGFFSLKEVLKQDTVIVGWEHLRDLAAGEAVASQTLEGGGGDVTVEVYAVEKLPHDHLLIVGRVANEWPEWLGAHVRLREGPLRGGMRHRDYSLALQGRILPGPWYGGWGGGGPMPFFMVFAPEGYGWSGGAVPEQPSLTFRAWGLAISPSAPGPIEADLNVNLTLLAPTGPPVVHELASEMGAN